MNFAPTFEGSKFILKTADHALKNITFSAHTMPNSASGLTRLLKLVFELVYQITINTTSSRHVNKTTHEIGGLFRDKRQDIRSGGKMHINL